MIINPYSGQTNGAYGMYGAYNTTGAAGAQALSPAKGIPGEERAPGNDKVHDKGVDAARAADRECQTCKERKYQDGSDEMVSFKSAAHISPEAAATRVRAHEQEHVSNAYKKAAKGNGEVIRASVTLHTAICPECGRSYVSGGTTETQIKYKNEENPYQQMLKAADASKYRGMNVNMAL